jgi:F-type H+-transporting ATPase subunit b
MTRRLWLWLALVPAPALAADEYGLISLRNTDFVVFLAFLGFLGILWYFDVFRRVGGMLDKRAENIRSEIDEARALREEAQTLLASYERKSREVQEQADRIVETAREEAREAGEQAKRDLQIQVERRLAGAEEQIASAEAAAIREIRDRAAQVAVAAAAEVIRERMDEGRQSELVDRAIDTVGERLH